MISFIYIYLSFNPPPYYYNPKIHNLGNIGIGGKIHSEAALFSTKVIDLIRYDGKNIRNEIMSKYKNKSVLDLCCGVGISTANNGIGIDTSPEMLAVAKRINKNKKFNFGNAENYKPDINIDIVTCMFSLHEMPIEAQINVISNAKEIAKEEVIIVDISSNYKNKNPPKIMLSGEPYLLDYLDNIDNILSDFSKEIYLNKHVDIWRLINY